MAGTRFRLLLLLLLGCVLCRPLLADSEEAVPANPQVNSGSDDDDVTDPVEVEEAQTYLRRFGYYDDDNEPTAATQRSATNVEKAIAMMQYKAHIPVTGKLNRATIAMMRQPRCGNKDFNGPSDRLRRRRRRYSLSGNKWPKNTITYRYINFTPDLGRRLTHSEIDQAFNLWSQAANLNFRETQGRADIAIRFAYGNHGDGYDFDGRGGVLAHAFFPGRDMISGDAHFDEEERFTSKSRDGTNLFMVAAHELGHSLGLGHSDVENSMMAPIYQGYRHGIRLQRDDIMGIQRLYGPRRGTPPTNPRPPSKPDPGPQPPSGPGPDRPTTPTCNIRVNAIMSPSPNNFFAFRNDEYWRIIFDGRTYSVARNYPKKFSTVFRTTTRAGRPLTSVDAAYRRADGTYRFFKGNEYFDFSRSAVFRQKGQLRDLFRGRQRSSAPNAIDAAVIVPMSNNLVYMFSGTRYWRLNDEDNRVDPGYPLPLTKWSRELQPGFDAAFISGESVYFVSGNTYRQFIWDGYKLEPGSYRFDRTFFGCGRLQDSSVYQNNGQVSSRIVRNWALVPTMAGVSIVACQMFL